MSTRYVWGKYELIRGYWKTTQEQLVHIPTPTPNGNKGNPAGYLGPSVLYMPGNNTMPYDITTSCKLQGTTSILPSQTKIKMTTANRNYTPYKEENLMVVESQAGLLDSDAYWYVMPDPNSTNGWAICCIRDSAPEQHFILFVSRRGEDTAGKLESYITTATNTKPTFDGYYIKSEGSDSIDPISIFCSPAPKSGKTVTVSVTPASNKYGGTISYQYQYSLNGGAWTNIQKTTATSVSFTVPSGMQRIQFRAVANDNLGFTSTTYVTSSIYYADQYTVSVTVSPSGSGTVSGGGSFYDGSSITVRAIPANGYEFVRWEENGAQVSTNTSYTFTISENKSLIAIFKQKLTAWVNVLNRAKKGQEISTQDPSGKARKGLEAWVRDENGKARRFL